MAKAVRVDTAQEELESAEKLAKLYELAGTDEGSAEQEALVRPKHPRREHEGHFALFYNGDFIKAFPTRKDANDAGHERLLEEKENASFLVAPIG